jgi:low affinity Fe/Cu permease
LTDQLAATGKPPAMPIRMLFLVVLCIVLWALGLMTSYTLGGLLHILLVVAIILFLVHVIQGRSIVDS